MEFEDATLPSITPDDSASALATETQIVAFHLQGEIFAFPMGSVREIIRMPATAHLPTAPASLMGVANLRGTLLPVVDLSTILFNHPVRITEASRVIVVDAGILIGMVVDRVDKALTIDAHRIDREAAHATLKDELLSGIIKDVAGHAMVMILNVQQVLGHEFNALSHARTRRDLPGAMEMGKESHEVHHEETLRIVTFMVEREEYAFPLASVQEIVRVPAEIGHVPKAPPHMLGMMNLRHRLLPMVCLRRLFGFPTVPLNDQNKVIVLTPHGESGREFGIVTDQVNAVLNVPKSLVEKLPELLDRKGEQAEIDAVCRLDHGARLISVLAPDRLVDAGLFHAADAGGDSRLSSDPSAMTQAGNTDKELQFVVFRLAEEEFGVPIEFVQEIIRLPDKLTHVPNTPAFIEGMVNLRGLLLPVIDLRTRLNLPKSGRNDQQRIVVFTRSGTRTGFVVDSVTEVLKLSTRNIEPAPTLTSDMGGMMHQVANLDGKNRMILLLNIEKLLTREVTELGQALAAKGKTTSV